jgi:hypothetical protein
MHYSRHVSRITCFAVLDRFAALQKMECIRRSAKNEFCSLQNQERAANLASREIARRLLEFAHDMQLFFHFPRGIIFFQPVWMRHERPLVSTIFPSDRVQKLAMKWHPDCHLVNHSQTLGP